MSGNVGIGTTNPNATLELYSTSQLTSRIILSGKEFFENTSIVSGGIALLCGVNRTGNRQLWIGDSLNITQNATNPVLRISIGGGSASVDCLATIGNIVLPISFGNSANITTINGSTTNISGNTNITGVVNIHNGTRYAILNYNLNPGSLIIGSTGLNYGGGTNWNGRNAAGLIQILK